VVPGSFEVSRLRELFAEQLEAAQRAADAGGEAGEDEEAEEGAGAGVGKNGAGAGGAARVTLNFQKDYEATTLGGLVSEIAGHIPLPGEVVEEDGLRLEVLASTDRKVERVRVGLVESAAG
jgi:hypothetical protein